MEGTISLIDMINILRKRWKLIVLLTITAAVVSGILSYYYLTPIYRASTQILVNQKNEKNQLDYSLLQSNVGLINTYSAIIKSPVILEKVIEKLELKESVDSLNQKMTINSQDNSQVFSIIVEDENAQEAVKIVNAISETFQQEVKSIMSVDNVSILAKAVSKENPAPVKPNPILNIGIAVVIGMLAGMGIAFLLDFLDNTLKDDRDVNAILGLPVLGTVKKMSRSEKRKRVNRTARNVGGETIVS